MTVVAVKQEDRQWSITMSRLFLVFFLFLLSACFLTIETEKGKLVFTDEQPEPPALGLAMSAKTLGGRS